MYPISSSNAFAGFPLISAGLREAGSTTVCLEICDSSTVLQAANVSPAAGNGLVSLAHQLIAAKLNVANGADPSDAAAAIAAADALIGGLLIPPIGYDYLAPDDTSELTSALTNYNQGATGPGHCE